MTPAPEPEPSDEPVWRRSWRKRAEAALIAALGAPLLRVLCWTLRVDVVGGDVRSALDASGEQYILALWHGRILPGIWFWRGRRMVVVTSENFDGEWIARIIRRFGYDAARGSSSRGGARALRTLRRTILHAPAAFTVDGPRGPARVAQPGVVWLSKVTGHPIVPFHAEADRHWTLGSWDATQIPRPFSRVVMSLGAPLRVAPDADAPALEAARLAVEQRLAAAEAACHRALDRSASA